MHGNILIKVRKNIAKTWQIAVALNFIVGWRPAVPVQTDVPLPPPTHTHCVTSQELLIMPSLNAPRYFSIVADKRNRKTQNVKIYRNIIVIIIMGQIMLQNTSSNMLTKMSCQNALVVQDGAPAVTITLLHTLAACFCSF